MMNSSLKKWLFLAKLWILLWDSFGAHSHPVSAKGHLVFPTAKNWAHPQLLFLKPISDVLTYPAGSIFKMCPESSNFSLLPYLPPPRRKFLHWPQGLTGSMAAPPSLTQSYRPHWPPRALLNVLWLSSFLGLELSPHPHSSLLHLDFCPNAFSLKKPFWPPYKTAPTP